MSSKTVIMREDKLTTCRRECVRIEVVLTPCFPAISSTMGGIIIADKVPIVFMIP